MAGLLADGLNLGLTRMAEACTIASLGQLAWVADWHIRDETYALALRRLVDHQQREPLAAIFGGGFASSSDGQFFRAGGFGRAAARINAHYGDDPGSKFYTHLSDRFAPFYIKVIAATASEALHVLDGLLYHQSEVTVRRHHTDGGGDSEHVFALLALLGFQFAPRIPDLNNRRLYSFANPSAYPALEPLIAGRINVALIRAHWLEILRVAASIQTGTVTASLIMRQLAAYPRQNGVAAALRELGRLERTLFTLDWIEDPELRRDTGRELNKGESRNSLARAVFIHRLGENSRPHLRKSAAPCFRPQSSGHGHHPMEHPLPQSRHRGPARDPGRSRSPSCPPVAARLGAYQSHRRLRLVDRRQDDGKP
jgi:TnpA family transposase